MKTLFLILISIGAFAQAPTTQEEFNYLTKGYKIQQESGLDVKKGYRVDDALTYTSANKIYSFNFKYLVREQNNDLAAVLIIAKSGMLGSSGPYYVCLPNDSENVLMTNYFSAVSSWDKAMLVEFTKAYTSFTSSGIKLVFNASKK